MSHEQYQSFGNRLALIPLTENAKTNFDIPANVPDSTLIPRPGANLRCPANQFVKFYQALLSAFSKLATGNSQLATLLSPQTIEAISAPHRVYMHDHTFNANIDWSLGFLINTVPYSSTTPYLYGPHASRRTLRPLRQPMLRRLRRSGAWLSCLPRLQWHAGGNRPPKPGTGSAQLALSGNGFIKTLS